MHSWRVQHLGADDPTSLATIYDLSKCLRCRHLGPPPLDIAAASSSSANGLAAPAGADAAGTAGEASASEGGVALARWIEKLNHQGNQGGAAAGQNEIWQSGLKSLCELEAANPAKVRGAAG